MTWSVTQDAHRNPVNTSKFTIALAWLARAATRSPVAITRHRKPKFVLMGMEQYRQLPCGVTRQVHVLDELANDLRALMIKGLERDLLPNDD